MAQPDGQLPPISEKDKMALLKLAVETTGKSFEQLTEQEQDSLFRDYDSMRREGEYNLTSEMPQGKTIRGGPAFGDQYFAPTWSENLAGAVQKGMGAYQLGKARQGEKMGRKAAGDLQTRADYYEGLDRTGQAEREKRRREEWMQALLMGSGVK
jgi:hypothetical protein